MAEPTLENICSDVQINICIYLHPSDILSLRKTCKAFERITRQRVVWVAALYRVCLENTLFIPSFPISDMSDLEIEKAALGPRRWIDLCRAFQKQYPDDNGVTLRPRSTRIINDTFPTKVFSDSTELFIVPGGRYLVSYSESTERIISVWDLGYTSSSNCKLIASVELPVKDGSSDLIVQATPDAMGLTIFLSLDGYRYACRNCTIYEIYPESETPILTKIAHLDLDPSQYLYVCLLPGTVIWHGIYNGRVVFRVWDYRQNHSISFSVDVKCKKFDLNLKVMATKTAVIVLIKDAVLIWAIPPLVLPLPPDFFDHNPPHVPPLFTIPFPDISLRPVRFYWNTISSWYFGSSQPLYFDMLCQDSKLHRFQVSLQPDLSAASLHVMNISEQTAHDFKYVSFEDYRICEDTLVSCWTLDSKPGCGVYMSLPFANGISHGGPVAKMLLSGIGDCVPYLCPASGRIVRLDKERSRADLYDFF